MIRTGLHALLSHWLRNPLQLFTLIAGLAMATALWSGVQAINAEARSSYAAATTALQPGEVGRVTSVDGVISTAEYVALRRAGWQVSPVLEGDFNGVRLVGVEPLTAAIPPQAVQDGAGLPDFFGGLIVVHPDDVTAFDGLDVALNVVADHSAGLAVADISVVQRLLDRVGEISGLMIMADQPRGLTPITTLNPRLSVQMAQAGNDLETLTDSFHLNLTAFGLLSFAVGIFIVYGAIGLAFEQRRPVFRTLRALGLPLRTLMALLCAELAVFAISAGILGCILGYLIAAALLPDVAATLRGLYGAEVSGQLTLRPLWLVSGLVMSLIGTAFAAAGAFWRLWKLPLVSSSQPQGWVAQTARNTRVLAVIAAILGILSVAIIWLGSGLVAGFAALACLLIGAALALPLVLDLVFRFAGARSGGVLTTWFWADTRQQLPGLSMALMALLLAMAANIGVSTMVSSFRTTFIGFLDQRLSSELYVRTNNAAQAAKVVTALTPKVDAILPIISVDVQVAGVPAEVFGVIDHATYRENWQMLAAIPTVWDRVADGSGLLINEQMSRRAGLGVGDTLAELSDAEIVGVFGDYGNTSGQIIMGDAAFRGRYPDAVALNFGIRTQNADHIADELRSQFNLSSDGVINQDDLKRYSLDVFERTFAVTAALNVLTLSVAGFAIMISLLTLATMRLPQLAPVWAMGLTRKSLARLELLRALCLAIFTGVIALPVGLALAWVLLAVVNVEAFGWQLPMFLFPSKYAVLAVLTLIAACLAALWPAMKLARIPPSDLLKVFSNAR